MLQETEKRCEAQNEQVFSTNHECGFLYFSLFWRSALALEISPQNTDLFIVNYMQYIVIYLKCIDLLFLLQIHGFAESETASCQQVYSIVGPVSITKF